MSVAVPSWDFARGPFGALVVVEAAEECGVSDAVTLASTGLARTDLARSATEVAAGQELTVIRNVLRALGNEPGLGARAGVRMTIGMLGVWGQAMVSSPTARGAIDVALRYGYGHFSFVFCRPRVEERASEVFIVLETDELPYDARAFLIERDLAAQAAVVPKLLGPEVPVRIETTLDPDRGAALAGMLAPQQVVWGGYRDAIVLPRAVLDAPLPHADPHALERWRADCASMAERQSLHVRTGLAATVRALLLHDEDGLPALGDLASALYMSPRTLRRRLDADGTSFRDILDDVRRALATDLLREGASVRSVAQRLGYAESASFIRAYKRWTGSTPGRDAAR